MPRSQAVDRFGARLRRAGAGRQALPHYGHPAGSGARAASRRPAAKRAAAYERVLQRLNDARLGWAQIRAERPPSDGGAEDALLVGVVLLGNGSL